MLEALGEEAVMFDEALLTDAAVSGSVELLAWLRERGCGWRAEAFDSAADSGCEAALEWLAEEGCPMPETGHPNTAAACTNGDLATARCLRRLGVPWGRSVGRPSAEAAARDAPLRMLRWLLEEGCPVDRKKAASQLQQRVAREPGAPAPDVAELMGQSLVQPSEAAPVEPEPKKRRMLF
ncbi:hypothetical protein GPECTOR_11g62 [Gonium pectorale]|uniref:Ankyrin repeat domain-containing protein n=1 Tax=Gonium pectorale TaxID=33097 RepID=A0A150GQ21_GONPE|nr:hypothetical protein GPECTOR_11g62 [Gonium pectorale]|eukprot:KXZ51937.1 hypothetical protein GPECTOR_11g62 [Gonium pectorale]